MNTDLLPAQSASALPPGAIEVTPVGRHHDRISDDLSLVLQWLRDYVGQPSPDLGRGGPVCPFVMPALQSGAMRLRFHYGVSCEDDEHIRSLILDELSGFAATSTSTGRSGSSLSSLLVVLPDAGPEGWKVIDALYSELKSSAVSKGLMIGQFHPDCDERAIRNEFFAVSKSPTCVIAIRHMAVHDILFLHRTRSEFDAYQSRFRQHYADDRVRDGLLRRLYTKATEGFALVDRGGDRG
ncbi:hypothetical protein OG920_08500 [Streptomyces europaeiscabiei]|uniref:DUF6875 domain-containing protein n=1 Tax=Streptomyces europaeiscabiei TaxID=146819 RepID=UPI0029B999EE|nr:hypothetical protein [Streptomyces europaeiscabiei]MDX3586574.1 hypothetical protein [Streptomyces europaeiscabiei]MDX3612451.1 hypothetical protein [Streptomyces europaeiscabiei]WUD31484.1 hypothetical protein OG858_08705 [Streptomyces europaeiscabiei]